MMNKKQAQAILEVIPMMRPDDISIELLEAITILKDMAKKPDVFRYKFASFGVNSAEALVDGIVLATGMDFIDANRYFSLNSYSILNDKAVEIALDNELNVSMPHIFVVEMDE